MKKTIQMIIMILLSLFLMTPAFAAETMGREEAERFLAGSEWQEIKDLVPEEADKMAREEGMEDVLDWSTLTASGLLKQIGRVLKAEIARPLRILFSLVGIIIISVLLQSVSSSFTQSGLPDIFSIIASVFVVTLLLEPVLDSVLGVENTIHEFSLFLAAYIPAFSGLVTSAGQPMTAAAYNVLLFGACQVVGQMLRTFFVPLLSCYLSLAIVSEVSPKMGLSRMVAGIKTFITWVLGFTMTVFFGILTIQSVVASGGDNIAVKTTKFFIASFIPVVGGSLSDLFVATHGCMQFLKGTVGAFGIVAAIFTFLPVLLKTTLWYLTVRCGSMIGAIFGVEELERLLKSIASAYGVILAILIYYALLFIISTTLLIVAFKGG